MRKIMAIALAIAIFIGGTASSINNSPVYAENCQFILGFQTLHDLIPAVVGQCLVNVHTNPQNGDALQETTNGLLVWRKADNFTAFTNGSLTWVNGLYGIQVRSNLDRFAWEADAAFFPRALGNRVSEAQGEWVTSSAPNARLFYNKSDLRWTGLVPQNRVWYRTLGDLLAAFPDRVPAE